MIVATSSKGCHLRIEYVPEVRSRTNLREISASLLAYLTFVRVSLRTESTDTFGLACNLVL